MDKVLLFMVICLLSLVSVQNVLRYWSSVFMQKADYIQKNALRLNYRPVASTIDVEFPDDIDPDKAPELSEAVIREVHQTL